MCTANRAAVFEVHKAGVNGAAYIHIAREIHINAGRMAVDLVQLVVSQHAVVATQTFAKFNITGGR